MLHTFLAHAFPATREQPETAASQYDGLLMVSNVRRDTCSGKLSRLAAAWDSQLNVSLRWPSKSELLADVTQTSVASLRALRKDQRAKELTVCEVNLAAGPNLAVGVLCSTPSNVRYVGFDVGNSSTTALRRQFSQSLWPRGSILRATASIRSVLAIKVRKALPNCDLLVINLDEAQAKWRQALLLDLAHTLRLTSAHNFVIAHGRLCGPESNRTGETYVWPDWLEFPEQCWHDTWREYVDRREVVDSRCEVRRESGTRFCVWRVNHSSHCTRSPPLLQRSSKRSRAPKRIEGRRAECGQSSAPITIAPAENDWLHSFKFKFFRDYRYFSLVPCEASDRSRQLRNASRASFANASASQSEETPRDATEVAWHGGGLCLLFKDGVYETWVAGLDSADGGRTFVADPQLVIPRFDRRFPQRLWGLPKQATLSHNYAVLRRRNGYVLVGGTYNRQRTTITSVRHKGIYLLRGRSWKWSDTATTPLAPAYKGHGKFEPL